MPDFSGRFGPKSRKGYATKTEYEILGEGGNNETPQQRFNRLQYEIKELAEELDHIKVCFIFNKSMKRSQPSLGFLDLN